MRYLRMLSNSLVAAGLTSAYVLVLVLQLNPHLSLAPERLWPIASTIGLYYGIHFAVVFYVLLVGRQLLAEELFSPAWISVGVLVWFGAAAAAGGAALVFLNARVFATVLQAATVHRMMLAAASLVAAAVLFVGLALLRAGTAPSARRPIAVLLVAVAAASVAVPVALRGRGVPLGLAAYPTGTAAPAAVRAPRVIVLAVDGASLDFVSTATSEGRLPNFGRLLDGGATEHMRTLRPASAEVVWAAAATGKLPQKNGIRSAAVYRMGGSPEAIELLPDYVYGHGLLRFGLLRDEPHTAAALVARPLWSILSGAGIQVGVVGWPLTHPAPAVRGYVVSDAYVKLAATPSGIAEAAGLYPPERQLEATRAIDTGPDAAPPVTASEPGRLAIDDTPARTDRSYERIAQALDAVDPAQVRMLRYRSLDIVGHQYLRYAMPAEFGDVTDEERRRFGGVLEQHYRLVDEAIGRAIAGLEADDLLLVVSAYGMEPLSPAKRLLERVAGDPDLSGTHDAAPDGFVIAYGDRVARGRRAVRASAVDIAPTLLYYLGLPAGRDMDGVTRTELFEPRFTAERPITFIPSYDR